MKIVVRKDTLITKAQENVRIYASKRLNRDSEECADFLAALRMARNDEIEITFEEYRKFVKTGGIIQGYGEGEEDE